MKIDETIKESIKESILKKLGSPMFYYSYHITDDGYVLDEEPIRDLKIDFGYSNKIIVIVNDHYCYNSEFMFDKEKALEFIKKQNIEFWEKEKITAQEWLDNIDRKIIEEKARKQARIEVANIELTKLNQ